MPLSQTAPAVPFDVSELTGVQNLCLPKVASLALLHNENIRSGQEKPVEQPPEDARHIGGEQPVTTEPHTEGLHLFRERQL